MLALAVLDRILSIDRQSQWLVYLCNSGYLRVLVESLRQDDGALQGLLMPQPPLLKPLYIYESKMVRLSTHSLSHCMHAFTRVRLIVLPWKRHVSTDS